MIGVDWKLIASRTFQHCLLHNSQNLVHEIVEPSWILSVEDCGENNTSHCYSLLQQEQVQEYEKLKRLI